MKTMELSNIDTHKHGKVDEVHSILNQVVYRLATLNPLWTFRVRDVNTNFQGVKVAMGFSRSLC